jgi:N-carbamoylputrescine amidase
MISGMIHFTTPAPYFSISLDCRPNFIPKVQPMPLKTLKVGLVQQACSADRAANLAASIAGIRDLASRGTQLILLSELHTSLYFCQTEDVTQFDLAETIPGPTTEELGAVACELRIVIVASLFERRAAGLYHNTAVVLERDGSIAGTYRKMHIPDDPGYYEKFYFTPGDLGFTPIDTSIGRLGVLVCWDQWYPEAARLMALAGAELLLYPTAIGWNPKDDEEERQHQWEAWIIIQRAHAVANGIPVVVCNRIGFEPDPSGQTAGAEFWGSSFIVGTQGEFLADAPLDESATLAIELDLSRSEQVRCAWPYLRDRRIDAYDGLLQRYLDR